MDNNTLNLLFQYASAYQFDDFDRLFNTANLSDQERRQAYLMQAQIKLFIADETVLEDMEKAGNSNQSSLFPCLNEKWFSDSPNRSNMFNNTPGSLKRFLHNLPQVEELMGQWFGDSGRRMVRQVHSEILYFSGFPEEALKIVKGKEYNRDGQPIDELLSQSILFRCYLATGLSVKAQESMVKMVRISKLHSACIKSYEAIREWANLTTGWSGDTPRFFSDSQGKEVPALDDRLNAIRGGISRTSQLEEPFVAYAVNKLEKAYSFRQYYMDIFHAIYWYHAGDNKQMESSFMRCYQISVDSGLGMPLVEYGKHIIPLLEHVKESDMDCSHAWVDQIIKQAERYEASLNAYRD